MNLTDCEYESLILQRVRNSGLPCRVCNNFYPETIRLTGNEVDMVKIMEYSTKAVARAAALGVETIVFGSSAAKNVPVGFPMDKAFSQIVLLLKNIHKSISENNITVVIEPLNKSESNIINTIHDGVLLLEAVDKEYIKLLVDYFHLSVNMEDLDVVRKVGKYIRHIHIANPLKRMLPIDKDESSYGSFFEVLKHISYSGRTSIEGYSNDFNRDINRSLKLLRELV
jgi:sugar phosphate isomerase/epimerase